MTTPESIRRTIQRRVEELFDLGLVVLINPVVAESDRVCWKPPSRREPLVDFRDSTTIGTYRRWALDGDYTALLYDGAIIQLGYRLTKGEISEHRLVYAPCPYIIDRVDIEMDPLEDLLDMHRDSGVQDDITMQTAIRFDYAPGTAGVGHPATHLTVNRSSCRIPVTAPMHPDQFLRFIFQHFYGDEWLAHKSYFGSLSARLKHRTITPAEQLNPHIEWHPH